VNGTTLTTEGQVVPSIDPSQPATVTITASNATASTLYRLSLRWFTASSLGTTQLMFDAISTSPTFTLPPGVLEAANGRGYILRATCETGFADAAHGDLRPRLPSTRVFVDSPVFTQ
jgi:hypothetical protein